MARTSILSSCPLDLPQLRSTTLDNTEKHHLHDALPVALDGGATGRKEYWVDSHSLEGSVGSYTLLAQSQSATSGVTPSQRFTYDLGKFSNAQRNSLGENNPLLRCYQHGCDGRYFSSLHNFRRHLKEKNGIANRYACSLCSRTFSRSTARNLHQQKGRCERYLTKLVEDAIIAELQMQSMSSGSSPSSNP